MENPINYSEFGMQSYKGYGLRKEGGRWFAYVFETTNGGRTWAPRKTGDVWNGYGNKLTAQRACDGHFGRL